MSNEKDVIKYWTKASKQDFETAEILFKNKKYHHALFFCHLSIEKNLKAIIIKSTKTAPPLVHDLVRLAEKTGIELTENLKDEFAEISTFNIKARYDDYKLSFYKKADKQFTLKYITMTKEILKWLRKYVRVKRKLIKSTGTYIFLNKKELMCQRQSFLGHMQEGQQSLIVI